MLKPNALSRIIGAGFAVLFVGLVMFIFVLGAREIVTVQLAILLFVALIGLYVGFGVLIAVYRFVSRLQ